jgi:hypothetical protein
VTAVIIAPPSLVQQLDISDSARASQLERILCVCRRLNWARALLRRRWNSKMFADRTSCTLDAFATAVLGTDGRAVPGDRAGSRSRHRRVG